MKEYYRGRSTNLYTTGISATGDACNSSIIW